MSDKEAIVLTIDERNGLVTWILCSDGELLVHPDGRNEPATVATDLGSLYEALAEREQLWREYEQFLFSHQSEPIAIAAAHGWQCSPETFARGVEYRRRLGISREGDPPAAERRGEGG